MKIARYVIFLQLIACLSACSQERIMIRNHEKTFDKVFESCIDKTDTNMVEIIDTSKIVILESDLQYLGNVTGYDQSNLQIIAVHQTYGLPRCPHGKGRIYIVKDKKVIGWYDGFVCGFKAYLNNGMLMVQAYKDSPFTKIDFSTGIPSSIFLPEDSCGNGDEYPFFKKKNKKSL